MHDNVLLTASFFGINTKTIRCLASVTWSHEVTELVLSEKVLNLSRRKITIALYTQAARTWAVFMNELVSRKLTNTV